jgi:hypothetical protein
MPISGPRKMRRKRSSPLAGIFRDEQRPVVRKIGNETGGTGCRPVGGGNLPAES